MVNLLIVRENVFLIIEDIKMPWLVLGKKIDLIYFESI